MRSFLHWLAGHRWLYEKMNEVRFCDVCGLRQRRNIRGVWSNV